MTYTILEYAAVALAATLIAVFVQRASFQFRGLWRQAAPVVKSAETDLAFLFEAEELVHASPLASALIAELPEDNGQWLGLMGILAPHFPSLNDDVAALTDGHHIQIRGADNASLLIDVERTAERVHLTVSDGAAGTILPFVQDCERESLRNQHADLRNITSNAPQLIWKEDTAGKVTWANRSYMAISDKMCPVGEGDPKPWPAHRIFKHLTIPDTKHQTPIVSRQSVRLFGEDSEHWFDVTTAPTPEGAVHYASDANATVRAERSQQAFMQTLSQTFAQLSVGLAIFDRQRQLTTFNPALLDLMDLPFSYLSARPSLDSLLDRLRDMRKLPEPKDYSSWKEQFVALENAVKEGAYVATWSLPDGQMLRVTGRPHPDGALAFVFEDISAEVSLTRRFRTEIQTGQAVLDTLPDAVAVFSASNTLVTMNKSYVSLWGDDASDIDGNLDLRAALRTWKSRCATSSVWNAIETFSKTRGDRSAWSGDIALNDGRRFTCHSTPIAGGMTMVRFAQSLAATATFRKISQVDEALAFAQR